MLLHQPVTLKLQWQLRLSRNNLAAARQQRICLATDTRPMGQVPLPVVQFPNSCKRICLHVGQRRPLQCIRQKVAARRYAHSVLGWPVTCVFFPSSGGYLPRMDVFSTQGKEGRCRGTDREGRHIGAESTLFFSHPSPHQASLLSFPLHFFIVPEQVHHSLHHLSFRRPLQ